MPTTSALALAGFATACFLAACSGAVFRPTEWYRHIDKPAWTPPDWLFAPAWTVLYTMAAVSGWLAWREAGLVPLPFGLYAAQLVFNAAWSGFFFGLRRPDLAFADLVLLWLSLLGTIAAFSPISPLAALLLVPYLAWVTFAGVLNLSVWRRNRSALGLV